MLLLVMGVALLATVLGWYIMGVQGELSPTLIKVQAVTTAVLLVLFGLGFFRLLPQRVLELCCLLYILGVCLTCMVLRLYWPRYGASIHLAVLYLWIPVGYLFAFMLTSHRTGLRLSSGIFVLFVAVSLPYLVRHLGGHYANLTVQLHIVSAVMIATLYFFSSYQYRLRLAQVTVDELAHLSNTDDLTMLPNRRHMTAVIERELARFVKNGHGFVLVLFDIDHFKAVNDGFGHAVGDAVLVTVATCAQDVFNGLGTLGRWGGDEFLALVRDVGPDDAMRMADALCAHVAASPMAGGQAVTVSCGVTVAKGTDNIDGLLQRADAALYAAKRGGRNRVEGVVKPGHVHEAGSGQAGVVSEGDLPNP